MSYKSLSDFIKALESENELIRINEYVNPYLEMTDIVDRISKSGEGRLSYSRIQVLTFRF